VIVTPWLGPAFHLLLWRSAVCAASRSEAPQGKDYGLAAILIGTIPAFAWLGLLALPSEPGLTYWRWLGVLAITLAALFQARPKSGRRPALSSRGNKRARRYPIHGLDPSGWEDAGDCVFDVILDILAMVGCIITTPTGPVAVYCWTVVAVVTLKVIYDCSGPCPEDNPPPPPGPCTPMEDWNCPPPYDGPPQKYPGPMPL
jgi:hypothetical protein